MRIKYLLNRIFLYNLFVVAASETNYGVGLSITQLNDIKNQFDRVNIKPKIVKFDEFMNFGAHKIGLSGDYFHHSVLKSFSDTFRLYYSIGSHIM